MIDLPPLPVRAVLPELSQTLQRCASAVLVAPPGAGKTTLVPLALLEAPWRGDGLILLLEPRRLAARAAARRMASLLGEEPGQTVGYAMRMDSRRSAATRILVVTESILSRMILDDPELTGIACILFDEFHERSLDGDFGLALALDVQGALRPDLRLLVMSATLDGARVAALLGDAPVLQSEGRAFPVETRHMPRDPNERIEDAVAKAVRAALVEESGSILAFLPGQREIERTAERLDRLPETVDVMPLYGAMEGHAQDLAIRPADAGRRKVVLATAIAETSITIDGVRVVIDSGLARVPRYEPSSGLTRLETVRVSRASADQRAGRAGRTEPGVAIRLWHQGQTAALQPFTTPEILEADLSGLLLDCAAFGVADPAKLAFLDQPPAPALVEARALLASLDALDAQGRLTETGAAMRKLALPVRLAHMVTQSAKQGEALAAAELAVVLTERGLGGTGVDLDARLQRFRADRSLRAQTSRQLAKRLAQAVSAEVNSVANSDPGRLLLHAWPDRIAKARGETGRFLLANGRGATLEATDRLARSTFLVVADLQGAAQNARIAAAAEVDETTIRSALGHRIERQTISQFDPERRAVRVKESEKLGAIILSERLLPAPTGPQADAAILDALRSNGLDLLPWSENATTLRERLFWLNKAIGSPWPDVSDQALLDGLETWLLPFLQGDAAFARVPASAITEGLRSLVPYDLQRQIDQLAPTHFDAPSGNRLPIRYHAGEWPVLSIRVQELFGLKAHPAIASNSVDLTLELLSPAHRPIQTTRDLPGFWQGSWADVRAEMRGRYPKHVWPEDPANAQATSRAKPRGT